MSNISPRTLLILQGFGIFLQLINAQLSILTQSARWALIIGAAISAFQYVIQHLGNKAEPKDKETVNDLSLR